MSRFDPKTIDLVTRQFSAPDIFLLSRFDKHLCELIRKVTTARIRHLVVINLSYIYCELAAGRINRGINIYRYKMDRFEQSVQKLKKDPFLQPKNGYRDPVAIRSRSLQFGKKCAEVEQFWKIPFFTT